MSYNADQEEIAKLIGRVGKLEARFDALISATKQIALVVLFGAISGAIIAMFAWH